MLKSKLLSLDAMHVDTHTFPFPLSVCTLECVSIVECHLGCVGLLRLLIVLALCLTHRHTDTHACRQTQTRREINKKKHRQKDKYMVECCTIQYDKIFFRLQISNMIL